MRTLAIASIAAVASAGILSAERLSVWSANIQDLNRGAMKAMQKDMDDDTTDCYYAATATNESIEAALDLTNYSSETFSFATFTDYGQVTAIQLMDQFTRCGYNNYLIELDSAFSKLPQLTGSVSNLVTQLVTGRSNSDTAVYLTLD